MQVQAAAGSPAPAANWHQNRALSKRWAGRSTQGTFRCAWPWCRPRWRASCSPRWPAVRGSCSCARPPASTAGPTTEL